QEYPRLLQVGDELLTKNLIMKKTFKYRLYPNKQQKEKINQTLETCRILYNEFLAERKEAYEQEQRKITCFEQINSLPSRKETNPFLGEVFSQILQDIARRVHKNFLAFFRRLKTQAENGVSAKQKAGYPRFKSKFRYDNFTYPQHGFKLINGQQIYFSQMGNINIRKHRELLGEVKTCSIIVKNNKYYACFSCEVETRPLPKTGKKVGIDLGLTSFLATSDGKLHQAPKTYKKVEKRLGEIQRIVSKRKKGSKRRKKAVSKLSVKHEKVANQRKDIVHKLSRKLVENYDFIAYEKLEIKEMIEKSPYRSLTKGINDAGWGLFVNILLSKVAETGKVGKPVEPKNTTQMCSDCHNLAPIKLDLSVREYNCYYCSYQENRDINAAKNVLWKATTELGTNSEIQAHASP
ncbi:11858_t:CDS:1, partial [Gigaspora margarita]